MQNSEVINTADTVLAENYQTTPPIDVYGIARNNGLEIIEKLFPIDQANIAGFITMQDGTGKLYVNLRDVIYRRRFTIAHELGHWRLHREELRSNPQRSILFRIAIRQLNVDPTEKEANFFAANLLVPLGLLRQHRDGKTNEKLAELFLVSTEVIGYRLSLLEQDEDVQTQESSSG